MLNLLPYFDKFPNFDLGNIILRQQNISDALNYYRYLTSEEVSKKVAYNSVPTSVEHACIEIEYWSSLFDKKISFYWGIALKDNDELIGTIGFNSIIFAHYRADLSYDLSYDHWGKGIMSKSLAKILEFAEDIGIVRVQAATLPSNKNSIKLLEKAKFLCEGTVFKYEYRNNELHDSLSYYRILGQDKK